MRLGGFNIYICTSPIKTSKYCTQEKINWITKHLGMEWLERLIICQDKVHNIILNFICYIFRYIIDIRYIHIYSIHNLQIYILSAYI